MTIDPNIIYLFLVWFLGWGIYFYAGKKRLGLAINTDLSTAFFFLLAALVFLISRENLPDHIEDNIFFYFSAIVMVFIAINHIYFLIRRKFNEPLTLIEGHPTDRWLESNRRAIFVTLAHILFQQMIITVLITSLWHKYGDLSLVIKYFVITFGLIHMPIVVFKGFKFMALYTLPAIIAGLIFPVVLIKLGFTGFILNFIIHSSFYVLLTYLFWHNQGKIKE